MADPAEREASLHFDPISQKTVPARGRLAAPWFRIHHAERGVGAPLVGALTFWDGIPPVMGRHKACPYVHVVIELRHVASTERRDCSSNGA
jgi:hypothetical protein